MKDDKAVQAALQILKENAETDFEKLSVARLETALTNPPKVNVIDDRHQEFNGKVYKDKPNDKHYRSSLSLHREVYTYYRGEIPENYVIHHQDLNPANNNIENLIALTETEHHKLHSNLNLTLFKCDYCGRYISKAKFKESQHHFCNNTCKALYRNANINIIEQTCVICGQKFVTRKRGDDTAVTCSRHCRGILRWNRERENRKRTSEEIITSDKTGKENVSERMGGHI